METFRLDRMTTDLYFMSSVVLSIPIILFGAALVSTDPARVGLLFVTAFFVLIYLSVWLFFRPKRFEITPQGLNIVWPLRTQTVAATDIRDVTMLDRSEFRAKYGWGMRIGAGGLWGGFGFLKTREAMLTMYISRTDRFVLIDREAARTMMLTPEDPDRFAQTLRVLRQRLPDE